MYAFICVYIIKFSYILKVKPKRRKPRSMRYSQSIYTQYAYRFRRRRMYYLPGEVREGFSSYPAQLQAQLPQELHHPMAEEGYTQSQRLIHNAQLITNRSIRLILILFTLVSLPIH